jgi:hypothetical protein
LIAPVQTNVTTVTRCYITMAGLPTGTLMSVNKPDELHAAMKNSNNDENHVKLTLCTGGQIYG